MDIKNEPTGNIIIVGVVSNDDDQSQRPRYGFDDVHNTYTDGPAADIQPPTKFNQGDIKT